MFVANHIKKTSTSLTVKLVFTYFSYGDIVTDVTIIIIIIIKCIT